MSLDVATAIVVLDVLGCASDPVIFRGNEMEARSIEHETDIFNSAGRTRIRYWNNHGRLVRGTLKKMVIERFEYALSH